MKKSLIIILTLILIMASTSSSFANPKNVLEQKIDKVDELLFLSKDIIQENKEDFIGKVNQIHIDFERYRPSDFSTQSDLEKYYELFEKLGKLDIKADPYINNEIKTMSKSWRYGDILFYGSGSNNAIGEKSFLGHTAVLSTTDYYVIEASTTRSNGAKVFHWNRKKLWDGASGIKQLKVTSKFGKNATPTERKKAVQYGLDQVDKPYRLKTTIWSTDEWYCSKLTNAQWDSVGYNLQSSRAFFIDGLLAVLPSDIIADANVRLVKNWGTSLPGKI